ncbi:MAG: AAA family ATPase [Geminicoccaceae bacterium]
MSGAAAQSATIDFLASGGLGEPVERVDTHGAVVLLGRERAWKLKRDVRYSFMDFSTLDRRRAAIEAELLLNRRTAPELYLRTFPVTRTQDGLFLDGPGEPVEWLLEMRRFPAEAELDRIAGQGPLDQRLLEDLAREIAAFHSKAEVHTEVAGADAVRQVVEGNCDDLEGLTADALDPVAVAALNAASREAVARQAALLDRRAAAGCVRHCHGDLHLSNIVLLDGRPVLFDCLEFDERLATIDVLYDLAFLLMDLLHEGHRPEALTVLQTYEDVTDGAEGLALLPLFLSMRAAIRAKVSGLNARVEPDPAAAEAARASARSYLDLALQAIRPPPPALLAIGGRSGTGKSTLAFALAPILEPMPGAMVLRSDVIRKSLFGKRPDERLPPEAYTPEVSERVFARIAERAGAFLAAGRSVICDGVYGRPEQRAAIEAVARGTGVAFEGLWLRGPEQVLVQRVEDRTGDASDADGEVVRAQARHIDETGLRWKPFDASAPAADVERAVRTHLNIMP